jgi:hypothetical protein
VIENITLSILPLGKGNKEVKEVVLDQVEP